MRFKYFESGAKLFVAYLLNLCTRQKYIFSKHLTISVLLSHPQIYIFVVMDPPIGSSNPIYLMFGMSIRALVFSLKSVSTAWMYFALLVLFVKDIGIDVRAPNINIPETLKPFFIPKNIHHSLNSQKTGGGEGADISKWLKSNYSTASLDWLTGCGGGYVYCLFLKYTGKAASLGKQRSLLAYTGLVGY